LVNFFAFSQVDELARRKEALKPTTHFLNLAHGTQLVDEESLPIL
jgi:hypothetical protein